MRDCFAGRIIIFLIELFVPRSVRDLCSCGSVIGALVGALVLGLVLALVFGLSVTSLLLGSHLLYVFLCCASSEGLSIRTAVALVFV